MKRAAAAAVVGMALTAVAAPPAAADRVRAKPRSCTPDRTRVVDRRRGVIFSAREVWYACAVWIGRSYNMFGPIYAEQFAPSDGGCDLGTNILLGRPRGESVRYRITCHFSFGVDQDGTIRFRSRLNLRTGVIRYRRLTRGAENPRA